MTFFLLLFLVALNPLFIHAQNFTRDEITQWEKMAFRVDIVRDTWGVPHIYGATDADVVFGTLYAQCEDDFPRVEWNYIQALGRSAETKGRDRLWHDLRMKLFYDTVELKKKYETATEDMKKLMNAFADGVNYFLYTHPQVKPDLLHRFHPWWPLLFSEGSIGGDIESVSLTKLAHFYTPKKWDQPIQRPAKKLTTEKETGGSNGFAISPSRSATGNALLFINPHTSFYFRSELHMHSQEGLQAYGAVTWGQFFIYQGFNSHCGWMHTSSRADVIDEYYETIYKTKKGYMYAYGDTKRKVKEKKINLTYKQGDSLRHQAYTLYYTHHGPIVASDATGWISVRLMQNPLEALKQSFFRTKSNSLKDFQNVLDIRTNSSNNTVYADDEGNIAYWHGNYMPRRDTAFNWNYPVDGSNPKTDWKELHAVGDLLHYINPPLGWIQNCNSSPYTATGSNSSYVDKTKYPSYMAPDKENARGIQAVRLLEKNQALTRQKLIDIAYSPYLVGFEKLIPSFVDAYDKLFVDRAVDDRPWKAPVEQLRTWNYEAGTESVATTIAVYFGEYLRSLVKQQTQTLSQLETIQYMIDKTTPEDKWKAFEQAVKEMEARFGTWKISWGEVNRFQRLTGKINEVYDDRLPSYPVRFVSSYWGSLSAFGSRSFLGTKKRYGYVGNSFVAVVEFGDKVKAQAVLTGGVNSQPTSAHFKDQETLFCTGKFRDVWFYKEDVLAHQERVYHPGQ